MTATLTGLWLGQTLPRILRGCCPPSSQRPLQGGTVLVPMLSIRKPGHDVGSCGWRRITNSECRGLFPEPVSHRYSILALERSLEVGQCPAQALFASSREGAGSG